MTFIEAKHYTKTAGRKIRVLVIHDMESPEKGSTAEAVARYFTTVSRPASAHYCIDNDSVVQCVREKDVAYAAPGCNTDGLHFEMAGYASQKRADWTDEYSRALLARTAKLVAKRAKALDIPIKRLTVAELKAGEKGIVGHVDVTNAYHRSTHTDPGPGFPWDAFIKMVKAESDALNGKAWSKGKIAAAAAALGLAAAVFGGVTSAPDPKPEPKPAATSTATAKPVAPSKPTPSPTKTTTAPVKVTPKPKPKSTKPALKGLLKVGSKGAAVKYLQKALKVTADGDFGPKTKAAVKKFQRAKGLSADGIVGKKTWAKIA